jgi:hypothetical protein
MLKTLFATSALASMLAVSAYAQNTPGADAQPAPPAVQVPAAPDANAPGAETPIVPDSAQGEAPAPADDMAAEPAPAPADNMAAEPTLQEGWSKVDVATISADQLIGAKIRTYDNSDIAEVQVVLFSADNQLDHVVARFGGFLGFGETMVLLDPNEVTVVKDPDGTMYVLTSLAADQLKTRPEYEAPDAAPGPDLGAAPDAG